MLAVLVLPERETQHQSAPLRVELPIIHVTLSRLPVQISPRERELVLLDLQGMSRHAIAQHMGITAKSVSTYWRNIYRKLDIHSRQELRIYILDQLQRQLRLHHPA